ncbi:hypothetical protein AXG93_531s1180 [Marchantia polymorpha subsp. ruderalis]|uniref:AB hydrolase-1 domain-containing protein n=1 Tax=Marchantia polymorpha subsp. ruderalis TaxID=1480154 RepID=A0A176VRJ5_MARPO|nr:hypothetical protein AXG93_531s1180 [Marchantia polymorpha subsp. ruderalis]
MAAVTSSALGLWLPSLPRATSAGAPACASRSRLSSSSGSTSIVGKCAASGRGLWRCADRGADRWIALGRTTSGPDFVARAGPGDDASGKTETEIENEKFVDAAVSGREGTAAATVAVLSEDMNAVDKVVELARGTEQEASVVGGAQSCISAELAAIYANCRKWEWRGNSINYVVQGSGPAVLLVHGFGASIGHWRKNIGVLAKSNTVYAIDLLGFGASAKPLNFKYSMETWAEACSHPLASLACLITSAEAPAGLVRGTVVINCAGGMNNKAVTDDWRLKLLLPILWLIDFILSIPALATPLFDRIRSPDNIKSVLQSVYNNKDAVDDELVEIILTPAGDPGALNAFITINSGPPGPKPQTLLPKINHPILVVWGDDDPFTPLDGPVGKFFKTLAASSPNVELNVLPNVGHCPHDDRPELVHEKLLPWLASLPA